MLICTLELPEGMYQDALSHKNFKVFFHCLRLSWKIHN
jgi:hypothetical protein